MAETKILEVADQAQFVEILNGLANEYMFQLGFDISLELLFDVNTTEARYLHTTTNSWEVLWAAIECLAVQLPEGIDVFVSGVEL